LGIGVFFFFYFIFSFFWPMSTTVNKIRFLLPRPAIALVNACRELYSIAGDELRSILSATMHDLIAKEGESFRFTDRFILLQEAEKVLKGKMGIK
jgi:hypothetical protein